MPLEFYVRAYNIEAGIIEEAIREGIFFDGLVMDASVASYFGRPTARVRDAARNQERAFIIDPVTHKLRSPHFRDKASYRRLSYYEGELPSLQHLQANSAGLVRQVIETERELGATILVSPYLYIPAAGGEASLRVCRARIDAFRRETQELGLSIFWSICAHVDNLCIPEGREAILNLVREKHLDPVYLLLTDFELGDSATIDAGARNFIDAARTGGVREIIYSHAPFWIYLLEPVGITAFISGVNYLATLKESYITRQEEIGGIEHNYYVAKRFLKMRPENLEEALAQGMLEPCECPACQHGVPYDRNRIREHYLFARRAETDELNATQNRRDLLRQWLEETEEFVSACNYAGIRIAGRQPATAAWRTFLG